MIRSLPLIPWRHYLGPPRSHRNDVQPYAYSHARTALQVGLRALGFQSGDRLLLPEFICQVVPESLAAMGIESVYYPLTDTLAPDWPAVSTLTSSAKGFLLVHYFGQPQPTAAAAEFCRSQDLLLIEDCAHCWGATADGRPLGQAGAMAFWSPRKCLPLPHGGLLRLADDIEAPSPPVPPLQPWRQWYRTNRGRFLDQLPQVLQRYRTQPDYDRHEIWYEAILPEWGMDERVWTQLQAVDQAALAAGRREVYGTWERWTSAHGLQPLFPALADGAAPMLFAAVAPDAESRCNWFGWGWHRRINVHGWPALPRCFADDPSSAAYRFWQRLVCFPIPGDLDSHALTQRLQQLQAP